MKLEPASPNNEPRTVNLEPSAPLVLVVLDGWGIGEEAENNGIFTADTPNFDKLWNDHPHTLLEASGEAIGLPVGQMGNSEVGHTTIGAGTVLYQDLVKISKASQNGELGKNLAIRTAFDHVTRHESQLHILGLLSPGGVHSHEDHFLELINSAKQAGVQQIVVHPFLDGRDVSPTSGADSLKKLENIFEEYDEVEIGSVIGRYYSMDRDTNWDRTEKAMNALFEGKAEYTYTQKDKPSDVVRQWYEQQVFDELMEPMVFENKNKSFSIINKNDAVIFTNFRSDRAKQLSQKISERMTEDNICFVTMTRYSKEINSIVAYEPEKIVHTLASAVSEAGLKQAHIAETEKYPHATYFLNGGKTDPHELEEHVLVPSRKDVKTHDEAPEMRAKEICDEAIKRLDDVNFMFINFANPDMVGHTAKPQAIKIAVETVDRELGRLSKEVLERNGALLVIADHGNAEIMWEGDDHAPHTSHTINKVPCIYVHATDKQTLNEGGGLKDVAPTCLDILRIGKPPTMTGVSLLGSTEY